MHHMGYTLVLPSRTLVDTIWVRLSTNATVVAKYQTKVWLLS